VGAAAVDGRLLVDRLRARLRSRAGAGAAPAGVIGGGGGVRAPNGGRRVRFGKRCVIQGDLPAGGDEARIVTVPGGWVHVAPVSAERGVIQGMVPAMPSDPAATLAAMTDAAGLGDDPPAAVTVFPAAPALTVPPCAPGWISVADGAVSLDPVSGLGTAWALRGGVLAAAVVEAIASGLDAGACLGHYEARLREALYDHVERCLAVYQAAFSSPAWRAELDAMAGALARERAHHPPAEFDLWLNGLRLEPRTLAGR
jgi:hypothetical protein